MPVQPSISAFWLKNCLNFHYHVSRESAVNAKQRGGGKERKSEREGERERDREMQRGMGKVERARDWLNFNTQVSAWMPVGQPVGQLFLKGRDRKRVRKGGRERERERRDSQRKSDRQLNIDGGELGGWGGKDVDAEDWFLFGHYSP